MAFRTTLRCLTRWVADDDGIEVAHLQEVMMRIRSAFHEVLIAKRSYIANALLNLAVARMIEEEGRPRASTLLLRLGDVVGSSATPESVSPIDISRRND
jgi:hypothetical protein